MQFVLLYKGPLHLELYPPYAVVLCRYILTRWKRIQLGYGKNYSLNELVAKINKLLGKDIEPKYIEMPVKNYVMETLADTSKIRKYLGFEPKIPLDRGLELLNEYYR